MNTSGGKPRGITALSERAARDVNAACTYLVQQISALMEVKHYTGREGGKVDLRLLFRITLTRQKHTFQFFPTLQGIFTNPRSCIFCLQAEKFPIFVREKFISASVQKDK